MRFGPRGKRSGAFWGAWKASLGRLWGALKAPGAGFPRPRSVKKHEFYNGFERFQFLDPVIAHFFAQAALMNDTVRLGSIL